MFDTGRDIAVTAVDRGNSSKSADQGRCGIWGDNTAAMTLPGVG